MLRSIGKRLATDPRTTRALTRLAAPLVPAIRAGVSRFPRSGVLFLHQGRCGSSVLAELLGQHPRMRSLGEIFNAYFDEGHLPTTPELMLLASRARAFPSHAIAEVKFFECQHLALLQLSARELVELAQSCGYERIIVLNRLNYLRKVVSVQLAMARGNKWHYAAAESAPRTRVHLDVERVFIQGKTAPLVELFEYMDAQYRRLRDVLEGRDVLELTYEEHLSEDPRRGYDAVCHWMGLDPVGVDVNLSKSNTMPLREVVENWTQVVETLERTPYAWMTREP